MERQTLQQEAPVYHVCQQCGGEGCPACSDLCILEGDIELDPYECRYCGWIGGHVDGCVFVDPDLDSSPINGVIGVKPVWKPAYEFIVVWKEDGKSLNKCFTSESDCVAHFESLRGRATSLYMVYPDGQSVHAKPVCSHCGETDYDLPLSCTNPFVFSPAVGDWVCRK